MVTRVRFPRSLAPSTLTIATLLGVSLFASGCSQRGSAEQLNAPIGITTRNTTVTVENRSGGDLSNVKLTVVAFGNAEYSKSIGPLAAAESRNASLGELTSQDGSTFSVTFTRPKAVKLTALDASGQNVVVETPWK
jgi:hypothetical protein